MGAPEPIDADIVIVGAGAAGLYAALVAADEGSRVAVVSATPLAQTASYWAQGGLAAALFSESGRAPSPLHAKRTLEQALLQAGVPFLMTVQIAGLARPTDTLVQRGDPASRKFAVFHLRDGVVAAVEAVNAAPEYLVGKKMIADGKKIAPEMLADTSIPMKQLG
jgi:succinate dehydrogenase/fumarate reductase flavoprotein subunit